MSIAFTLARYASSQLQWYRGSSLTTRHLTLIRKQDATKHKSNPCRNDNALLKAQIAKPYEEKKHVQNLYHQRKEGRKEDERRLDTAEKFLRSLWLEVSCSVAASSSKAMVEVECDHIFDVDADYTWYTRARRNSDLLLRRPHCLKLGQCTADADMLGHAQHR